MSERNLFEKKLARHGPVLTASISAIVRACQDVFREDLHCVVLCGSLLKEDFVPNYSDADIHVYVADTVLEKGGCLKLDYAVRFQEAIGHLSPRDAGVSQFQVSFFSSQKESDWNPLIAGTFVILYGTEVPTMRMPPLSDYLDGERRELSRVRDVRLALLRRFADKSDVSALGVLRLTGTELKGFLYALCAVITENPEKTFKSPLDTVLNRVSVIPGLSHARSFFEAARDWKKIETETERMREVFVFGMKALEAIERWQRKEEVEKAERSTEEE